MLRFAVAVLAVLIAAGGSASSADPDAPAPAPKPAASSGAAPAAHDPKQVPRRPEDQFFLGNRYLLGQGLEPDPVRANELFRMAAERGHDRAQLQLGLSYLKGRGIERNPVLAMEWIEKAAEQNNPRAQSELGLAYWSGTGVRVDRIEAVKWLQLSAWGGGLTARGMLQGHAQELTPEQRGEATARARQWRTDHGLPPDPEPSRGRMHIQ